MNTYSASAPLTSYPDRSTNSGSGKLALVYSAPREWVFHSSVGTAFRNPNIYDLYNTSLIGTVLYEANPNLQPEKLRSWEVGVRKRMGDRINFDAAYYENYIDDLIYRKTVTPTDRISVNAAAGRTRGLEATGTDRLTSWLRLRGTYAYTNAIITRNPAVPTSEGMHVPYVPSHITTGELLAIHKRWTGSLTARYQSRVFSSDANTDTTKGVPGGYDPHFLTGATLGYTVSSHLELYTSAQNLLDRQYYLYYLAPGRTVTAGTEDQALMYSATTQLFYQLSNAFFWPVAIALMVLFVVTLVDFGALLVQAWRKRSQPRTDLAAVARGLAKRSGNDGHIALDARLSPSLARFWTRLEARLAEVGPSAHLDLWLEETLQQEEMAVTSRLDRTRAFVRIGPMLGLAGTIIPLGPALQSLLAGDLAGMVNHLVIGFGAVVCGLVMSGVSYAITLVRERWARVELKEMENLCELILRSRRDAREETANASVREA